jgi:hypothetical protein
MSLNIMATILRLSSDIPDSTSPAPEEAPSSRPHCPVQLYGKIGDLPAFCGFPHPWEHLFARVESTSNLARGKDK